ncbi:MAG: hypothetical protein ABSA11_05630 [Candidatus Bathyarchaeia archaeon]|jgi:hypothetical protein
MKTVLVTNKEFETIPGYTTGVDVATWKGKIDTILYRLKDNPKVQVVRKAWLTEDDSEMLLLELKVIVGRSNVQRHLSFKLEPVMIQREVLDKHRNRHLVTEDKTSWRLFYELLSQKLAAARLGLTEIQYEFMPYISMSLPGGGQGTLADILDITLEADRLSSLGQIEDKRERRVVDAEVMIK